MNENTHFFSWWNLFIVLWHDMARTYRACIIGLLGVVGVLHIMYLVFANATVIILSTRIHPTNVGGEEGNMRIKHIIIPPPALVE